MPRIRVARYAGEPAAKSVRLGSYARAAGQRWGGSVKGRRIKVSCEQVEALHRLRGEGVKVAAIARTTGLSRPTIYRLLSEQNGR